MDTREIAIINSFYDARIKVIEKRKQDLLYHICQMAEMVKCEEDQEFSFFLQETIEYLEELVTHLEQKSDLLNREKEQWLTTSRTQ